MTLATIIVMPRTSDDQVSPLSNKLTGAGMELDQVRLTDDQIAEWTRIEIAFTREYNNLLANSNQLTDKLLSVLGIDLSKVTFLVYPGGHECAECGDPESCYCDMVALMMALSRTTCQFYGAIQSGCYLLDDGSLFYC